MQEQQYGKTDLSRKQINICFKIITNTMTLMDYPLFQG